MRSPTLSKLKVLAIFLAFSLLFSQWLGLVHAVAHAGWQHPKHSQWEALQTDHAGEQAHVDSTEHHHHHVCAEYDALTLALSIHSSPTVLTSPLRLASRLVLLAGLACDPCPAVCPFSSRAPPLLS